MGLFFNNSRDEVTSIDELIECFDEIKIKGSSIKSEKTVENKVLKELREYFEDSEFATQYSVKGYLGLRIDIDVDNGDFGIEIKLANQLVKSAAAVQRLIGQAIYYKNKQYDDLIVLIVGSKKNKKEPMMKELMQFLEDLEINVYYLTTS